MKHLWRRKVVQVHHWRKQAHLHMTHQTEMMMSHWMMISQIMIASFFQETANSYEEDTISTSLGINLEVALEISPEDMLLDEISMLDV